MIDLSALVLAPCFDAFAEPVDYRPETGAILRLRGVFDERSAVDKIGADGFPVTEFHPVLCVREAELPAGAELHQNQLVELRGRLFRIADIQPDGHGHARLILGNAR